MVFIELLALKTMWWYVFNKHVARAATTTPQGGRETLPRQVEAVSDFFFEMFSKHISCMRAITEFNYVDNH